MSRKPDPRHESDPLEVPRRKNQGRVLMVEDERRLARKLAKALTRLHYVVDSATNSEDAKQLARLIDYNAIVLARTLPGGVEGLDLLRHWRFRGVEVPIMMMGRGVEAGDRVEGLNCGADDYMTKPFPIEEFLARINQLVRRGGRSLRLRMQVADVELDPVLRRVTLTGKPISLASKEFAALEYLLLRQGNVVTRTELIEHVWNDSFDPSSNVVDATVYRLRTKIDRHRECPILKTIVGVGYMLTRASPVSARKDRAASPHGRPGGGRQLPRDNPEKAASLPPPLDQGCFEGEP